MTTVAFNPNTIMFAIGVLGALFTAFNYFKNPQIKTDQTTIKMQGEIDDLKRSLMEVKETHIKNVESDIKALNTSINALSQTVVRLATIIDERIPKANVQITPQ